MSECKSCRVIIRDPGEYCPLCRAGLARTEGGEMTYPDISARKKKSSFILRLLLFLWVAAVAVCAMINLQTPHSHWWFLIVAGAGFYPVLIFYHIFAEKGYLHRIFVCVIVAVLEIILVDAVFGFRGWSVDYVLPGALLFVDVVLLVLMIVNHRNWQSYLISQLFLIFLSLFSLLLILLRVVAHPVLSEIAILFTVLLFLGTFIIGGGTARMELKRRFHF